MSTPTARQMIRQEYGDGKNFMTPTVIKVGKRGPCRAWELSTGTGFRRETIYGVSVVDWDNLTDETTRRTDLGECFQSLSSAESYIADLPEKFKEDWLC